MRQGETIGVDNISKRVKMSSVYVGLVRHLARGFSYDSLTSPISCQDLIKGTLRAHASLNKRNEVCMDDLRFVLMLRPYLTNPFSPYEGKIVRLRAQGLSFGKIEKELGKVNYVQQIQRVIKKAELRGILDRADDEPWNTNSQERKDRQ
jgi:hypothetical protein